MGMRFSFQACRNNIWWSWNC